MRGIKIPLQDFALKMQGGGGLYARGAYCGTLWYFHIVSIKQWSQGSTVIVKYKVKWSIERG